MREEFNGAQLAFPYGDMVFYKTVYLEQAVTYLTLQFNSDEPSLRPPAPRAKPRRRRDPRQLELDLSGRPRARP